MSRDDTRRYVIAYDIPDDGRRSRLAKRLQTYGDRLQYSVFAVDCRPAKLERLRAEIRSVVDTSADSVLICDLGPLKRLGPSRFTYIGLDRPITPAEPMVL